MDSSQAASKRMSAIPRPGASKLPQLNARPAPAAGGLAPSTRPAPATNPGRGVAAGIHPPAVAAAPKSSLQASRLTKRSSIAHLPRATAAAAKDSSSLQKPTTTRTNGLHSTAQAPKASSGQRAPPTGTAPRVTQMKRPQSVYGSSLGGARAENEPRSLRAPEGARGLSRQRSRGREDLREEEPAETLSPVKPRTSKPSRPSLSDRTIESLHALPSTPRASRQSDFFSPGGSPMTLAGRPKSSLSRTDSITNGPGTHYNNAGERSLSPSKRISASAKPATRMSLGGSGIPMGAGNRRSMSIPFATKLQEVRSSLRPSQRSMSPVRTGLSSDPVQLPTQSPVLEARDPSSEPVVADPTLDDTVNEPVPTKVEIEAIQEAATPSKAAPNKSTSSLKAPKRDASRSKSPKSRPSLGPAFAPADGKSASEPQRATSSSSTALRQQIAAAKAAARKEKLKHDSPQDSTASAVPSFDIQLHTNPFNDAPRDEKHILRNRINTARVDGKLNIAAMNLRKIPDEVLKMYDAKAMEECNVNWAEVVDLTRLIAADNELDELDETVFPDRSPQDVDADGCAEGNQFGGLEFIDLHGNLLTVLPMGLRRLERLTSLNLAHNKLDNAAFDVLAEIQSLKDLRLGNNSLSGNLPTSICALPHLETLDLQSNRLLGLPEAMRELVNLRVLNVSGNQLTTLPMDSLEGLPLVELDASSNLLIASLFPLGGANGHPSLQVMNVANNSLAALTFLESLHLPHLRSLNVSNNHLTVLPSVAGWTELITLAVGDNKIAQFPEGFTKLQKLRIVNFASNELRLVDPDVTRMSSLETLILAANPLREKKFLSMSAGDIKRELRARMTPSSAFENGDGDDVPDSPVTVIGAGDHMDENATSSWQMKANGVLELVAKNLGDDFNDLLASYFQANEVRDLVLQSNKLTCIPPAMSFGQDLRSLDLTDNPFSGADYLDDVVDLPFLQELSLSKCRLLSLDPLLAQLRAPHLRSLNVCANRLTGAVPLLRIAYPKLSTFLASDNKFEMVSADALRGLANVNLASNNIAQLPAELGLLWDEGLRHLDVGSNSFRVPNYRILERGTEATLRWLRNKLPASAGSMSELD